MNRMSKRMIALLMATMMLINLFSEGCAALAADEMPDASEGVVSTAEDTVEYTDVAQVVEENDSDVVNLPSDSDDVTPDAEQDLSEDISAAENPDESESADAETDSAVEEPAVVGPEVSEPADVETDAVVEDTAENVDAEEQTLVPALAYLLVNTPEVTTPGEAEIVAGIGNESVVLDYAYLTVVSEQTGEVCEYEAASCTGGAVLFRAGYSEADGGSYHLASIRYSYQENETVLNLDDIGICAGFGVNAAAQTSPDDVWELEESDTSETLKAELEVNTIDEYGELQVVDTMSEALSGAAVNEPVSANADAVGSDMEVVTDGLEMLATSTTGRIVIVLDPGHDSGCRNANGALVNPHTGAHSSDNVYKEEELNLKIAQYCKQELLKYENVRVFMTRTTNECPNPYNEDGSRTASTQDNYMRVAYAASLKADYYIAIHLNSADSTSARGAEVYYPNENYATHDSNPNVNAGINLNLIGKDLADAILNQLVKLGLYSRGIKIRDSATGDQYPDNSLCDYYGIIRNPKLNGICGIIIEHCFLSTPTEASQFLGSEAKLKALGVADANGIVKALNLTLQTGTPVIEIEAPYITGLASAANGIQVNWDTEEAMDYDSGEFFRLYRKAEGGEWTVIASEVTANSYLDTTAKDGVRYAYRVKAYCMKNWSDYSAAKVLEYVAAPTLNGVNANEGVKISWDKIAGAAKYQLFRSVNQTDWVTLTETASLTYTDSTASSNKVYYYRMRAVTADGSLSGYSSVLEIRSVAAPVIKSIVNANEGVQLKWTIVSGMSFEDGDTYRIYRKAAGEDWKTISSAVNANVYIDTSAIDGVNYTYRVKACRAETWSGYSLTDSITCVTAPVIKDVVNANTGLQLSWTASSNMKFASGDCYRVYRMTDGGSWSTIASTVKDTTYIDTTAKDGVKYSYRVKVCRSELWSGYSLIHEIVRVSSPEISSMVNGSDGIALTWKETPNMSYSSGDIYRVYRKAAGGDWVTIASSVKKNTYTDTSAKNNVKYSYRIKAMRDAVWSGYSETKDKLFVAATTISSLTSKSTGVQIVWSPVSGVSYTNGDYYRVYRKAAGGDWTTIASAVKGTSYTDRNATGGVRYAYRVKVYHSGEWSGYSETKTITPFSGSLAYGDSGTLVKDIQTQLTTLGYYTGSISGKYDDQTETAVSLFQSYNTSTSPTGTTDLDTFNLIFSDSARKFTALKNGMVDSSIGSTTRVTMMQTYLKQYGYYYISIDGDFGSGSANAVSNFQRNNGLSVTGVANLKTMQLLFNRRVPCAVSVTINSTSQTVWNFLIKVGMTPEGAAGIMGNIDAESSMNPKNLEGRFESLLGINDEDYTKAVDDGTWRYGSYDNARDSFTYDYVGDSTHKKGAGYGLVQFTWWSQKQELYDYAKSKGKSVGSATAQLGYLVTLLKTPEFKTNIWDVLTTTHDIKTASDVFLLKYERPADQSTSVQLKRAGKALSYYNTYANQ